MLFARVDVGMFVVHVGIVAEKVEEQFYYFFYGSRDCLVFGPAPAVV